MRRIAFTLVGIVALVLCGNQVAMAHGYGHGGYHHSVARHVYPQYLGGGYGGYGGYGVGLGYGAGYGGGYGCGSGYAGYGAPYGYGYPQPGFGVATPNFSMFVR